MSEKRSKKRQAQRQTHTKIPAWLLLLLGSGITAAIFLFVPRLLTQNPSNFLHVKHNTPTQTITQHQSSSVRGSEKNPQASVKKTPLPVPKRSSTEFDFYTVLPNKQNDSITKVNPHTKAEPTAHQQGKDSAMLPEQKANRPIAAINSLSSHGVIAEDLNSKQKPEHSPTVSTRIQNSQLVQRGPTEQHYMLQVGAFGGQSDAESTKARLALLGINAHVESAPIGEHKIIYRVRIGPYVSSKELSKTRQKLTDSGVHAIAIELH